MMMMTESEADRMSAVQPNYDTFVAWLLEHLDATTRHRLIADAEQTLDATASASDATTLEASLESFVVEAAQLPSTRPDTPGTTEASYTLLDLYRTTIEMLVEQFEKYDRYDPLLTMARDILNRYPDAPGTIQANEPTRELYESARDGLRWLQTSHLIIFPSTETAEKVVGRLCRALLQMKAPPSARLSTTRQGAR